MIKKNIVYVVCVLFTAGILFSACSTPTKVTSDPNALSPAAGGEQDSQVAESFTPEVKLKIVATDPNSVVLASGELQLIEFFAFW